MPKGVYQHKRRDLLDQTFGRWTVVAAREPDHKRNARWLCRCACGVERVVLGQSLLNGMSESCGCLHRELTAEMNRTHDMTDTGEYRSWVKLIGRCCNKNDPRYARYGGRGITVCDRWRNSFEAFFADMGPRPSARHSIDRINNDGNYEPSNCRWATPVEQSRNRAVTRRLSFNGESLTFDEWAARLGLDRRTIETRVRRGWSTERALSTPSQRST